jgi:Asp-tRNA(Asn)/Glu-tRNA(Gln) amidotransferase A subunit family amidase
MASSSVDHDRGAILPACQLIWNTTREHSITCITLPGGMPMGTQVMGQPSNDARVTAIARWLLGVISPVVVG